MKMAQPSCNASVSINPVCVIGTAFISPYEREVIVDTRSPGNLVITDANDNIMFKLKPHNTSLHRQFLLLDAYDKPLVMLRKKIMSEHSRWNIFRGDSKADSDMIFSTKTPHVIQNNTNVNVFLANNMSSNNGCDFNIKGSWSKKTCTVYIGDSSKTIAQMHEMLPPEKKFMVTIYPNVDCAFVVTLIAIVYAMKNSYTKEEVAVEAGGGVIGAVVGAVFF